MKLAIVSTHPVQYNAPLFKLLASGKQFTIKVFYTWGQSQQGIKYDPGFGKEIEWDIPLLEGYDFTFVENISEDPGTHHFKGIINPSLNKELADWGPSAILIYGWSFKSHLQCIRFFYKKIPLLFRGDSTLLDEKPGIKKLFRLVFLKWVYSHIDYALYVGKNNKAYFLKHGVKESQLIFSPHAIDNDRFFDPGGQYQKLAQQERLRLDIDENDVVLLFAGKFEQKKNPFFLLEIAKRINDKRLKILFVGNGTLENDLKKAAATDQRILFMDFCNQSKMPLVYRTGDVLILPSSGPNETWGLAANEAMACGLALMLSSKTGSAADLVNGANGIVFDIDDVESCIGFITGILKDGGTLLAMKQASQKIIQQFSYGQVIHSIEKLLEDIKEHA